MRLLVIVGLVAIASTASHAFLFGFGGFSFENFFPTRIQILVKSFVQLYTVSCQISLIGYCYN